MKTKYKILTLLAFGALVLTGCNKTALPYEGDPEGEIDTPWKDITFPITSIEFDDNDKNITLNRNDTYDYNFTFTPYYPDNPEINKHIRKQLKWVSSNDEIATVSDGKVTALSEGNAVITISSTENVTWQPIDLNVSVVVPLESFSFADQELNLTLDQNDTYTLRPIFVPYDTSYQTLNYVVEDTSIVTCVNGVITAGSNNGSTKIHVTSPALPNADEVVINVSVAHIAVESIALTVNGQALTTQLELGKTASAVATVTPENAQAIKKDGVRFYTSTPEILEIDEESGEITTIAPESVITTPLEGKVYATLEGVKSNEVVVNVYEVIPTGMTVIDAEGNPYTSTIELSNNGVSSVTVGYSYEVTEPNSSSKPTRKAPKFMSDDPSIASIDPNTGVINYVSTGSTYIYVTDTFYGVTSAKVAVNVKINATSVSLISDKTSLLVGEVANLSVNVAPTGLTDDTVIYSIPAAQEAYATLTQVPGEKTATLEGIAEGEVTVTATCNGISDQITISVYLDHTFHENTAYVVGDSDYSSGTSKDVEGGSWNDAVYANVISEVITPGPSDPENLDYQVKTTITFREGDMWKIRFGNEWKDIQTNEDPIYYFGGQYEMDTEGSVIKWSDSPMTIYTDLDGNRSVLVNTPGSYDIYYKIYDRGEENEWWSVYATNTPVFTLDPEEITLDVGMTETIEAKHYNATYEIVNDYDDTLISVVSEGSEIQVTALDYGTTVLNAVDNKGAEASCTIIVNKIFEANTPYVVGSADYSTGVSSEDEFGSWTDASKANKMTLVIDPGEGEGVPDYQRKTTITFAKDDLWKIRFGEEWRNVQEKDVTPVGGEYEITTSGSAIGWEDAPMTVDTDISGNRNIKVNEAGKYDIYYKIYDLGKENEWWSVYATKAPVFHFTSETVSVDVDGSVDVVGSNYDTSWNYEGYDEEIISVTRNKDTLTITGLAYGDTTITATDNAGDKALIKVSVAKPFTTGVVYLVGNKDFSTGESKADAKGSWNAANKALAITTEVPHAGGAWQVKGTVKLEVGDMFKFRVGDIWNDIDSIDVPLAERHYEIDVNDSGMSFSKDKEITVNVDDKGNRNLEVLVAGYYDIYYKVYNKGTEDEWFNVWIGLTPDISVDQSSASIGVGDSVDVNVSNNIGEVSFSKNNNNVNVAQSGNKFTITGVTAGITEVTFTDAKGRSVKTTVTVSETLVTVTFVVNYNCNNDGDGIYMIGDFCDWKITSAWRGTWNEGHNWKFTVIKEENTVIEFKFVKAKYENPTSITTWEGGSNRSYTFKTSKTETMSWQAA